MLGVTDNEDAAWREEWEVSTEERERELTVKGDSSLIPTVHIS